MLTLTQDDFIALLQRTTDESWLRGLLEDPDSNKILRAVMDEFSRVDEAAEHGCGIGLISTAPGGTPGVCTLTLARTTTTFAGSIPKGYRFLAANGIVYVTTAITPVLAGQSTVLLHLETLRQTELVNTVLDTFASVGVGTLDEVSSGSPVLFDAGTLPLLGPPGTTIVASILTYVASTPTTLGASDYISAHGRERGQQRQAGEPTDLYRGRVRNIPDAVSPKAIAVALQGVAQAQGLPPVTIKEPFEDGATPSLKANYGLGSFGVMYADVDFCDDPEFEIVSRREACAYFRIETDLPPRDPDSLRAFYDGPTYFDDPVYGFPDIQDHPVLIAGLMAIIEEANRKRAACVNFDLYLPGITTEIAAGATSAAIPTVVWTLTPPAGKVWLYVDGMFGHSPNPAGVVHFIVFNYDDATSGISGLYDGPDSQRITRADLDDFGGGPLKRITSIEGGLLSDGVHTVKLLASFRVLEVTI